MTGNLYLTDNEEKALRMMAEAKHHTAIRKECEIPHSGFHAFTYSIRRKTGIRDHKDDQECRDYLRRYAEAMANRPIADVHVRVLRRVLARETFAGIGYQEGKVSESSAFEMFQAACHAAGIFTTDKRALRVQIRIYLATFHPTNGMPLSPIEEDMLRKLAFEGMTPAQYAREYRFNENERHYVLKARDACERLGFNVQGNGTQRQMLKDYFLRMDARPAPVTMDDPMF